MKKQLFTCAAVLLLFAPTAQAQNSEKFGSFSLKLTGMPMNVSAERYLFTFDNSGSTSANASDVFSFRETAIADQQNIGVTIEFDFNLTEYLVFTARASSLFSTFSTRSSRAGEYDYAATGNQEVEGTLYGAYGGLGIGYYFTFLKDDKLSVRPTATVTYAYTGYQSTFYSPDKEEPISIRQDDYTASDGIGIGFYDQTLGLTPSVHVSYQLYKALEFGVDLGYNIGLVNIAQGTVIWGMQDELRAWEREDFASEDVPYGANVDGVDFYNPSTGQTNEPDNNAFLTPQGFVWEVGFKVNF